MLDFGPRPSILRRVINYSLATEGTQGFSKPVEGILTGRVKGLGLSFLQKALILPQEQASDLHALEKPADGALFPKETSASVRAQCLHVCLVQHSQ